MLDAIHHVLSQRRPLVLSHGWEEQTHRVILPLLLPIRTHIDLTVHLVSDRRFAIRNGLTVHTGFCEFGKSNRKIVVVPTLEILLGQEDVFFLRRRKNEICCIDIGMETKMLLLSEVAALIQVPPHKIVYAMSNHSVDDVAVRIGGRRMFRPSDVQRLARYFGVNLEKENVNG